MATLPLSRALLRPVARRISPSVLSQLGSAPSRLSGLGRRTLVSATSVLQEQRTMKLPGLGDSITEGAIVEWVAKVGQAVQEGDVVAMVETDKVTVDIKAEMDGVITEQFSAIDDTIEVGADLYKIDTEAEASVGVSASQSDESSAVSSEESEPVAAAAAQTVAATSSTSSSQRTPSINFLGKEGWERLRTGIQAPALVYIPPMYGRPAFSEDEMEALVMGFGPNAPDVKANSDGAIFG